VAWLSGVAADLEQFDAGVGDQLLLDLVDELDVDLGLPAADEDAEAPAAVGVEEDVGVLVFWAQHLERAQDGGQLGDVVGALADELAVLDGLLAALDEHADAGRARVAATRAVGVNDDRVLGRGP